MYAHLLSSAGVRDADLSFANEAEENASGRDALGTGANEISGALAERRSSAIGGTPSPRRDATVATVATVDALRETVPALNRALEDLGYPSPLELLLPDAADLARTCDVLFLLLRDRQEDLAAREAWADERARARTDVAAAETRAERLRVSRDAEAAARVADANRRDRADDDSRARLERMTAERDAARRDLRASTQKLARLERETRRRELEHDRLKARLSAVVESREMRSSRDAEKHFGRGGVTLGEKSARLGGGKKELEKGGPSPAVSLALHHSMMAAYEAKLRAFMHDANDLRAMLREAGVDPETRATAPAAGPERSANATAPGPTNGAERCADGRADLERADEGHAKDEDPPVALDAFAFNLASLRDRLGDADAEAADASRPGGEDAAFAAAAAAEAAAPASPVEIALRWHEREHARLSKEALGASSHSGCPPGSPGRSRSEASETRASERLAWNAGVENDAAPVRSRDARARRAPPSARPNLFALEASPEVSSSEPDEEEAGVRGGAFEAARGDGSSSEEVFEEVFEADPPARETKPEPGERQRLAPTLAPRREKVAANLRQRLAPDERRAHDERLAPAGASAPASPASPLDALLARHLGPSRAPAAGPPRDRSEWLEKRRRRANPFAAAAE